MYLLYPLLLTAPIATLALTSPLTSSDKRALQARDAGGVTGIPANGVTCATPNEEAHLLTPDMISAAMVDGKTKALKKFPVAVGDIGFPGPFSNSTVGLDELRRPYTIYLPETCPSFEDLWAIPIAYTGKVLPPDTADQALPAGSTVTSDLVLFTIDVARASETAKTEDDYRNPDLADVTFCVVVTNSMGSGNKGVVVDGKLNANRGGYQQCNAEPV